MNDEQNVSRRNLLRNSGMAALAMGMPASVARAVYAAQDPKAAAADAAKDAKKADPNKKLIKDIVAESTQKSARDRAEMQQSATAALAGTEAKRALVTGDAFFGYGDYAKAAELYRAALTKTGGDKDLINLHLGMALARAGDKAGASAALNAVAGPRAELAKYWLLYVNTR